MSGSNASDLTREPPDRRKLVAVLFADMVGYSRLIRLDDAGTLKRLRALRRDLIDPAIEEHGGIIVQTGGDSLLIVFDSIEGAVRCAVKLQQQVPIHDRHLPPDRAIRFRIGINIGDAIADGTDLHGDAVNVAARLQAECPPGAICVSRSVRDHIRDQLDLTFEELGTLDLKNIARPIEAFVVRTGAAASVRPVEPSRRPRSEQPSVAVLPFANLSGDPEQEYFADGLVEEITTNLSRVRSLLVIARNSSFTYKGRAVDVKQVGRELGVRYVLEGSVRKAAGRVRIAGQLIDTTTGAHLWADRFEGALDDIFGLQDQVTVSVVGVIEPTIRKAEIERVQRKPPDNLQAYDLVLRGLSYMRSSSRERVEEAIRLFRRATEIDPSYALAFALLSGCSHLPINRGWVVPAEVDAEEIARNVTIALELGADDPEVLALSAYSIGASDLSRAIALSEKALALNPSSILALTVSARSHAQAGNTEMAIERLERAARLNPLEGSEFRNNIMSVAYFHAGQYETAIDYARKALLDRPDYVPPMRRLAALLGLLSRIGEAREVVERLLTMSPKMTISRVRAYMTATSPPPPGAKTSHYCDAMCEGLRRAGLPE